MVVKRACMQAHMHKHAKKASLRKGKSQKSEDQEACTKAHIYTHTHTFRDVYKHAFWDAYTHTFIVHIQSLVKHSTVKKHPKDHTIT